MTLGPPIWPLPPPFSRFGVPRGTKTHNGTDWAAPLGTPLHAMSSGVVVDVRRPPDDSGNALIVDSDDGRTQWSFSHMQSLERGIGSRVSEGEVIGRIGMTGHTTGPHVHVRVGRDGRTIDPESVVDASRREEPPSSIEPVVVVMGLSALGIGALLYRMWRT